METRAVQNSVLRIGGFEVPVALHAAQENKEPSFRVVNARGKVLKRVYIDVAGKVVPEERTRRAVEDPDKDGKLVMLKPQAIEAIKEAGKIEGIEIEDTIALADIPIERIKGTYYVTIQGGAPGVRALRMVRDGLKKAKVAATGKLALKGRQHPFVMVVRDRALVLMTLRFAENHRNAIQYIEPIDEVPRDETVREGAAMVAEVLSAMKGESLLDEITDDQVVEKRKLVADALAGKVVKPAKEEKVETASEAEVLDALRAMAERVQVPA